MTRIPERALAVVKVCAAEHGVAISDILGRSTKREHAEVRYDAIARVYALHWPSGNHVYSTTKIAGFFDRDASTISDALKRADEIFGPTPAVVIGMAEGSPA